MSAIPNLMTLTGANGKHTFACRSQFTPFDSPKGPFCGDVAINPKNIGGRIQLQPQGMALNMTTTLADRSIEANIVHEWVPVQDRIKATTSDPLCSLIQRKIRNGPVTMKYGRCIDHVVGDLNEGLFLHMIRAKKDDT